jgi:hypothetical protein
MAADYPQPCRAIEVGLLQGQRATPRGRRGRSRGEERKAREHGAGAFTRLRQTHDGPTPLTGAGTAFRKPHPAQDLLHRQSSHDGAIASKSGAGGERPDFLCSFRQKTR